jgi:DNA replication and repair protein RecF
MRISEAKLQNFRNLVPTDLKFSHQVNLFIGANGQGKTNLLEALNYVALGRSHRSARAEDLINFAEDHLHVQLSVVDDQGEPTRFEYGIQRGGGRRFRIDDTPVRRRSELVGKLVTVFFSPDSIGLVRQGPEKRRRFVDQGVASIDRYYLGHLQSFQRALRQKNRLLHEMKKRQVVARQGRLEMEAWNRKLARHGVHISRGRAAYARWIQPHAARIYAQLAAEKVDLEFAYQPNMEITILEQDSSQENEHLEREILAVFDYIIEDEIRRGRPISGPQMDDFVIRLSGHDLRAFGSQGETRTAAISLIMAQSDVVQQMRSTRPILFFDDIFSELDRSRSQQLQELSVQHHQLFIATARSEDVAGWQPSDLRVWEVAQGRFEAVT